jgi:general secretion pathway protein G
MKNLSRGFTLVEIILVIACASVVITLVDPVKQFQKSNDAKRKSDLRQIQAALELFRADNGTYPLFGTGGACNTIMGWSIASDISCALSGGSTVYMNTIPKDPKTGVSCPGYLYSSNGSEYNLFTKLENTRDPDALASKPTTFVGGPGSCADASCTSFNVTAGTCSGNNYNYWVSNP